MRRARIASVNAKAKRQRLILWPIGTFSGGVMRWLSPF
ncbi:hypothetical protein CEV32_0695 [Brucella rhizosphaerae]|uniref:Uncharacterized protein n=1 Tax=Brucella rhizosphaerae TaxID=571254 RepID=A0A256FIT1_9HYPH|nr:hypothetical protein CEV32_0695 [Brucella rhizosphaerae]